jgi:integrase/recombinase XerD
VTVKPILDTRVERKDNFYPIFICIRHRSKVKYLSTGYRIKKESWIGDVVKKHSDASLINAKITSIINDAKHYYADCLLHNRPFDIDLIGTGSTSHSLTDYMEHRAKQYNDKGQIIVAAKVLRLRIELMECFGVLYMDAINNDSCRKYEAYLIKAGNGNNTRAKKFKTIGQLFGHAVKDGKAAGLNHFKEYKIIPKPVKKDKLTVEEINRIAELQLQEGAVNDARNLFLFSYYCKGMRFENCITAKRADITNGRINFRSNKGNKHISVRIHRRLIPIINSQKGSFIFTYIDHIPKDKKEYIKKIDVLNAVVNKNLKILAAIAGIKIHLTFHVARHSFASHLMHHTDSIHVIKESLGHSDYRTTEVYLKSLGDEVLDKEMDKLYGV